MPSGILRAILFHIAILLGAPVSLVGSAGNELRVEHLVNGGYIPVAKASDARALLDMVDGRYTKHVTNARRVTELLKSKNVVRQASGDAMLHALISFDRHDSVSRVGSFQSVLPVVEGVPSTSCVLRRWLVSKATESGDLINRTSPIRLRAGNMTVFARVDCVHATEAERPFLSAVTTGDVRTAASVKRAHVALTADGRVASTFHVAFRLSSEVKGEVHLSVKRWLMHSNFSGINACVRRAEIGGGHKPGAHVEQSPLPFKLINPDEGVRGQKLHHQSPCTGRHLPGRGSWVVTSSSSQHGSSGPLETPQRGLEPPLFDQREIFVHQQRSGSRLSAVPFRYFWQPAGCSLREPTMTSFVDGLAGKDGGNVSMTFVGDSTLFYMCKVWATLLSGHRLRVDSKKYTKTHGVAQQINFSFKTETGRHLHLHCNNDGSGSATAKGQVPHLSKHVGGGAATAEVLACGQGCEEGGPSTQEWRAGGLSILVVGGSNAWSLCHGDNDVEKILEATRDMVATVQASAAILGLESAAVSQGPPVQLLPSGGAGASGGGNLRVVWMGPVFTARSYTLRAASVQKQRAALWRSGAPPAVVVELWHLSKPLVVSSSTDGLHYHTLLPRNTTGARLRYEIAGVVPIYGLKLMATGLLNSAEQVRGGNKG